MSRTLIPFLCSPHEPDAQAWLDALRAALPEAQVLPFSALGAQQRETARVAIVANPDPQEVRALPALEWVHSVWAGVERLLGELGARPLHVVRLVDPALTEAMAEAVLAWTLYLHRDMPAYAAAQREARWAPRAPVRAAARTVSLLGCGELGSAAAARLHANGFTVRAWRRQPAASAHASMHHGAQGLRQMLGRTDILVCLLPLTPQTRGLLDAAHLALLPRGAALVNFARGPILDAEALRAALDEGRLSHAVLDVFDREPLPATQWEWRHPRVTVLPHVSAPTDRHSASAIVARAVRAYLLRGELPPGVDRQRGY